MKVEQENSEFQPVTITLETYEEFYYMIDVLGASHLLNSLYTDLCDLRDSV